jgi:hypothetical protein
MTMETKQTTGTRELAGDAERVDEPRGRFERDDEARASATAASVPEAATRADEGTARERDGDMTRRDDAARAGSGTLDRDETPRDDTSRDDSRRDDSRRDDSRRDDSRRDESRRDDMPRSTSEFAASSASSSSSDGMSELLSRDDNDGFQSRWETIQTGFVDEPRRTVEQADELVAEVMKRLAEGFAAERERLEQQWGRGEDVSTEDLRLALQRYRSFFQRLLDV